MWVELVVDNKTYSKVSLTKKTHFKISFTPQAFDLIKGMFGYF